MLVLAVEQVYSNDKKCAKNKFC